MADIPEPVRIALEDVTPVIAAAFADDACLIWSGEHRAYWVAGGNGYTTGAAYAGRWTIADAYRQTKHCDPTKQIAFERVDASRAAPPAMDREAVELDWRLVAKLAGEHGVRYRTNRAFEQFVTAILSTLSADAIRQGEGGIPEYGHWLPDAWDGYLRDIAGWNHGWAKLPATFRWHEFYDRLVAAIRATPASHASDGGKA